MTKVRDLPWAKNIPPDLAPFMLDAEVHEAEICIPADEIPKGFSYPKSYIQYIENNGTKMCNLKPWGLTCNIAESSVEYSKIYNRPLVVFAQAFHEDMIACFEGIASSEPRVIIIDPWRAEGPDVVDELPNFEAWLGWAMEQATEHENVRLALLQKSAIGSPRN